MARPISNRKSDGQKRLCKRTDFTSSKFRQQLYETLFQCAGNVTKTCLLMNIYHRSLYAAFKINPEFKKEFDVIRDEAIDRLEDEAIRRGHDGIDKPVFYMGRVVGYERVYSDHLIARVLAAYRKRYRTSNVETTGEDGGPIEFHVTYEDSGNGEEKP